MIVGDNPGNHTGDNPLYPYPIGCAGYRLWQMTDLSLAQYRALEKVNLFGSETEKREQNTTNARTMWLKVAMYKKVLLLGEAVRKSMCPDSQAFDMIETLSGLTVYCLPHPSGRNRVWNDAENVHRAVALLRDFTR